MLSDLGAEVIKIERAGVGDDTRRWEPCAPSPAGDDQRHSCYFLAANRGKKSLTIDLSQPKGADIVRRLAAGSDILIENYKTGDLDRYGLGFEALSKSNPGLIYCSITGFGQTGPYRSRAGYDTIVQAMGGLMHITGESDDMPAGGPQRCGLPVIDLMTGVYAAAAILAALRHRDATGHGQYIDMSLLDVQVSSLAYFGLNYLTTGRVQQRSGNRNPVSHPSGVYTCSDGRVVVIVGNNRQFTSFCTALGVPQLASDERFAENESRVGNALALDTVLDPLFAAAPVAHWLTTLSAAGVPCGPINDIAQVFADPQVLARGAVTTASHPVLGEIPLLASPMRLSATPTRHTLSPPMLGEHTSEVLRDRLGLTDDAIVRLRRNGIV
ncbi:CaiB/BaiF CoA-transferase family protein [Verticiella sediminum]